MTIEGAACAARPAAPAYRLFGNPGWGSAIVETQLAHYGLPYAVVDCGDIRGDAAALAAVLERNPLGELPILVLPTGVAMTETAAMTLHLADVTGRDDLVPGPEAAERPAFLRWLIFLVANIYPAGNYHDRADRLLPDATTAEAFRHAVMERRKEMWRQLAAAQADSGGPWMLGARFSALDIFIAVMIRWNPGRAWFDAEIPAIARLADRVMQRPALTATFARNSRSAG